MSEPGRPRTESFKISQTAPNPKPLLLLNQKKDEKRKKKNRKENPLLLSRSLRCERLSDQR